MGEVTQTSADRVRIQEVRLENAIDLLDVLHPATGMFRGGHLYRGQADSTWGLVPSAFRENAPFLLPGALYPKGKWVYGAQVQLEIELLWLFTARANAAGLMIPENGDSVRATLDDIRDDGWWVADPKNLRKWPPRELVPILALAQHHGVPTRLLDWSYSPMVAAYFAAEGAARRNPRIGKMAVWVCERGDKRRGIRWAPSAEIERPANAFNENLRAQRGCLMVWRSGAKADAPFRRMPLEQQLSEEADRAGMRSAAIFYKLTLPQSESGALLQLLSMHEMDGATLFPGFDGVARVVRERVYWDGYEGTGANSFDGELNRRGQDLFQRLGMPDGIYFDPPEIERPDSLEDRLKLAVSTARRRLDAGDPYPNVDAVITQFEQCIGEASLKLDRQLRHDMQKVLDELKAIQS